ncbi:hypothetical protein [Streptantibioticus ferralitis]|uniref:Integral membrane protein n=1 Tax=Streptantibioticus ferralitis TaxID=236510 RepID=A0ABT5Z1V5_9ACTN|nr:hypothetical protein [Streptantibioticus ferralitis]MDF2257828.1 hypothetical protein [Streptantibioticus ferralitis]
MRRPVVAVAAGVLIIEAFVIAFINLVLGLAVKRQSMSLGGLAPGAMSAGAFAAGAAFAVFLLFCAAIAIRTAVTDRAPGRFARIVLVVCAVLHGLLGAAVVGMVGWPAFVAMMVTLGLVVATLVLYAEIGAANNGVAPEAGGTPSPTSP